MEEAEGPELTVNFLTTRILALNFAAIHVGPDFTSRTLMMLKYINFMVRRLPLYASNSCCSPDMPD